MSKQKKLPGMESTETELGKTADEFVEIREEIAERKLKLKEIGDKILIEMKKEGRLTLVITADGANYKFEIKPGEDSIVCKKVTRDEAPKEAE